jgi:pilus assembly protein CpaB
VDRRKVLLVVAVLVAVLGAGLVFVYAQGAEDRAAAKIKTQRVLVAVQPIQPGESAADAADLDKMLLKDVPEDQLLEGATADGTAFTDAVALTTIYPGEQVTTNKFGTLGEIEGTPNLPLPEGKAAMTLELTDAGRVAAFAQPGSHVAIYVTPDVDEADLPQGTGAGNVAVPSCLLEPDVLVLAVGSRSVSSPPTTEEGEATAETVATTLVTVAGDSQQIAALVGLQNSEVAVTMVLINDQTDLRPTAACTEFLAAFREGLELGGRRGSDDSEETNG